MKTVVLRTGCWMLVLASLLTSVPQTLGASPIQLRIGAAQVDITPAPGIPMAGYYSKRAAQGTHDPLHAKAIVLQAGNVRAAIVALDLIRTERSFVEPARQLIAQQTGIPADHVMISATHAHTGPVVAMHAAYAEFLGGTDPLVARYVERLPQKIAECVAMANKELAPASVAAAIGREKNLAFNRRFHMRDGSVGWNPGKLNPAIVRPAGPVDPSVPFVLFRKNNKPVACYVNFAMHLDTVGGLQFSADYPYTLSKLLANSLNPNLITVFTIGSAGDINHVDVHWKHVQKGNGEAARIGTRLAAAVLRSVETDLRPVPAGRLQVRRQTVRVPLAPISDADIASARAVVKRLAEKSQPRPKFLEQVQAFKVLDVQRQHGKPWQLEIQVITLGDQLAWVSFPGEAFVQLGLAIKRGSPFRQTMIAELANGSVGYIPDHLAYGQGNYEVVSTRCADGAGELLVDTAVTMLREMYQASTSKHK